MSSPQLTCCSQLNSAQLSSYLLHIIYHRAAAASRPEAGQPACSSTTATRPAPAATATSRLLVQPSWCLTPPPRAPHLRSTMCSPPSSSQYTNTLSPQHQDEPPSALLPPAPALPAASRGRDVMTAASLSSATRPACCRWCPDAMKRTGRTGRL
jgi:hypothetical protein